MKKGIIKNLFYIVFCFIFIFQTFAIAAKSQDHSPPTQQNLNSIDNPSGLTMESGYGIFPLYFIHNKNQYDKDVLFTVKTSVFNLWLTRSGLVFDCFNLHSQDHDISQLIFINARPDFSVHAIDKTSYRVNYFHGNDPSQWVRNVKTSKAVLYKKLYPNIDLKIYGNTRQIEYDFIVSPGGKVSDIGFAYKDISETYINKEGELVIKTNWGEMVQAAPVAFQFIGKTKVPVDAHFQEIGKNSYGFEIGTYNRDYILIIDPLVKVYASYLGGSENDHGYSIAVDNQGAAYVAGTTKSADFPLKNTMRQEYKYGEAFVTKIAPDGKSLVYSTYLGGISGDTALGIAVDSKGQPCLTGNTPSRDFPIKNAYQKTIADTGYGDAFITKFSSKGNNLVYSTYLGGSKCDFAMSIALDKKGSPYIVGFTYSEDFPLKNAIRKKLEGNLLIVDAFVTRLSANGKKLIFSTYLGGEEDDWGMDVAVDSKGHAYVTGQTDSWDFPVKKAFQPPHGKYTEADAFVTKIKNKGKKVLYSSVLGGSYNEFGNGIAVDDKGAAYLTGHTTSKNFPLKNALYKTDYPYDDAYMVKVAPKGKKLEYSSYLGGNKYDRGFDVAVSSDGTAFYFGYTSSPDFPRISSLQQLNLGKKDDSLLGTKDIYIVKVDSKGSKVIYSTLLGGTDNEGGLGSPYRIGGEGAGGVAVDKNGAVYVTCFTFSVDFPVKVGNLFQQKLAGKLDAFVAKIKD